MFRVSHTGTNLYSKNTLGVVYDRWEGSLLEADQLRQDHYLYGRSQQQFLLHEYVALSLGIEGKLSLLSLYADVENP